VVGVVGEKRLPRRELVAVAVRVAIVQTLLLALLLVAHQMRLAVVVLLSLPLLQHLELLIQ
jgi:hypothetical protein